MDELRRRFLKTYVNLPLGVRSEIIAVIDKEPMTWRVCWREIDAKTKMSKKILKYLDSLEFI